MPTSEDALHPSLIDHYADPTGPYGAFPQERRRGGTFGVRMVDVQQGTVETVDPPVPEFAILTLLDGPVSAEIDFGDGWRVKTFNRGAVDIQPARTACAFRIPAS